LVPSLRYGDGRAGQDDHPLAARWVPDFTLTVDGRAPRLAELARTGRPLLVHLTGRDELAQTAAIWWPPRPTPRLPTRS
jgi:hypothetical protein